MQKTAGLNRRRFCGATAATVAAEHARFAFLLQKESIAMSDKTALRPFQVEFPEADLTELRRRITATRWPDQGSSSRIGRRACRW